MFPSYVSDFSIMVVVIIFHGKTSCNLIQKTSLHYFMPIGLPHMFTIKTSFTVYIILFYPYPVLSFIIEYLSYSTSVDHIINYDIMQSSYSTC